MTSPPHDDPYKHMVAEFALELRRARRRAGDVSYPDLCEQLINEHEGGRRFAVSEATIQRAFAGKALPKWELVRGLLLVFGVSPHDVEEHWKRTWVRVREHRDPLGTTMETPVGKREKPPPPQEMPAASISARAGDAPGPAPQAAQECAACGALVSDLVLHRVWHDNLEVRVRRQHPCSATSDSAEPN
ncbi:helix-turn-helix domain-containing protein [Spirillospora sp. CA-294931]|uniref:helix-turn-helix domain-containing protein n=1 Tax=Spirillospora sp. CA-294931 TaxID=3240042 RepID=UPI003D9101F0